MAEREEKLERWRAERLWRRAAELESSSRDTSPMAPSSEPLASDPSRGPDAVELSAAVAAAVEGGMDSGAIARSVRLELVLGELDATRPSPFEGWAERAAGVPAPPLAAPGESAAAPAELLAAFDGMTSSEQYGLRLIDGRELGGGAVLRVYEIASEQGTGGMPFRERLRSFAGLSRLALVVEPGEGGGSRFELLADTRRSARIYGAGLIGASAGFGLLAGGLAVFALPASAFLLAPIGLALGAVGGAALVRALAGWAFPTARKELAALARALGLRGRAPGLARE
jgi:hypothetical protein